MEIKSILQFNKKDLGDLLTKVTFHENDIKSSKESKSYFKRSIETFFSNPVVKFSIIMLIIVTILILVAFIICPYKYDEIIEVNGIRDISAKNLAPFEYSNLELEVIKNGGKIFPHMFGTDSLCRDYFSRCMVGTLLSLCIGIIASVLVIFIGVIYGSIAGFAGGKVDLIMMRIVDVIHSIPDMLIIILLSVLLREIAPMSNKGIFNTFGPNIFSMFVVYALLYWVSMARTVRGQILSIRERDYITALKIMGASKKRIIIKHIIPNCLSVIFIAVALQIPSAIFTESYLSFVGMGVEEPMPSLGSLASNALPEISTNTYKLLLPSLLIVMIVLSFNLVGNALRDAFDPKSNI